MTRSANQCGTITTRNTTIERPLHTESLRSTATRGVVWSVFGMLGDSALRFISSLILTRLLFPEAFGVVVTASILFMALELFSDIGLVQAVIQNSRGEEARYLDTAWTLQIVRGLLLTGLATVAAYPFAGFYQEPVLVPVILIAAVGSVLRGFGSPALFLLKRRLALRRLTIMELTCNVFRVAVTISLAYVLRNVWALVVGGLCGQVSLLVASYMVWSHRPRLHFDRIAAREMLRFGRFILLSGILGFLTLRLDSMLIPRYLGMGAAGVYYVAVTIAMMLTMFLYNVVDRVFYPAFCQLKDDFDRLRSRLHELLEIYCSLLVPLILLIAANAKGLVQVLYDPRYAEAGDVLGWLLAAALIQGWARLLNSSVMAMGRSYVGTVASLGFLVCLCGALPLLASRWQMPGYAAAKMLGSFGMLVPLIWYARSLRLATCKEFVQHMRVPCVTLLVLMVIRLTGPFMEASLGRIMEMVFGTLAVGVIIFIWQRTLFCKAMDNFSMSMSSLAAMIPQRIRKSTDTRLS